MQERMSARRKPGARRLAPGLFWYTVSIMSTALSRRDFFRFGGLSLLSPGLLHVLAGRVSGATGKAKSCIVLFQLGGPYQCETFDPKPSAPDEVRGLFKPSRTPVPGIQFIDGLPLTSH